jgi:hypothetical protein
VIGFRVEGSVEPGLEPVRDAFAENFAKHGEVGAACCVYREGRKVVDLWGGFREPGGEEQYTADTRQLLVRQRDHGDRRPHPRGGGPPRL